MNSFIYIDGIVLCLCIAIFLMTLITIVILGCAYAKVERNNCDLQRKNKKLQYELSASQDELYKAKFEVPDVENDYSKAVSRSELEVTDNV